MIVLVPTCCDVAGKTDKHCSFFKSQSDPMVVAYAKKRDGSSVELGRTEVIMNNLNPIWIGKIPIAYQFEIVQPLV